MRQLGAPRPARSTAGLLLVPTGLALCVAAWPGLGRTQSGDGWDPALAAALTGEWTLAVSEEAAQASVEAGIAAAVASLPPLVDGMAASQLRARLVVSRTITLTVAADRIQARFVHASFDTAPGMPATVPVPGDSSETMEIVQLLRAGRLEQIFTTAGGRRWSTFTPSEDGARLTLDAVVHSERLPTDVRFRIPYRRRG